MKIKIVFTVLFSILTYVISSDIYTPSMPSISEYFGESSDAVQRTLTLFFLGAALSCFFSGYFADRWGKTRVSLYAFCLALMGSVLAMTSQSLEMLVFGRFLMGCGVAVAPVIGLATLQEKLPEDQTLKIFGMMGVVFAIVPGVAPMVGGFLDTALGWRSNFYVIFFMILVSLVSTYFFLEDDTDSDSTLPSPNKNIFKTYGTVLSNKTFLAYSLIIPLIYAGEWATFSFLPFYAEHYLNLSPDAYGLYLGAIIVWFGVGSLIGGKLANFIGIDNCLYLSLTFAIFGSTILLCTAYLIPTSAWAIYISFAFYFMTFGILFPTSVPRALGVFKTLKSSASALRGMMITLVGFFATYAAELMDESKLYQLALFVFFTSVAALCTFIFLKPKVRKAET